MKTSWNSCKECGTASDGGSPEDATALCQSAGGPNALAKRLQDAREEERSALSRELHDTLGQHLTAFALTFESVCMESQVLADGPPVFAELHKKITDLAPMVERLIEQTQTFCAALRPGVLDELGLVAAIEWLAENTAKRTGMEVKIALPAEDVDFGRDIALALFRITQEALTNVTRHAQAAHAEVRLFDSGDSWTLEIEDRGQGVEPASRLGIDALGLFNMRERVGTFGGTVQALSEPGMGTTVRVRIPCGTWAAETGACK